MAALSSAGGASVALQEVRGGSSASSGRHWLSSPRPTGCRVLARVAPTPGKESAKLRGIRYAGNRTTMTSRTILRTAYSGPGTSYSSLPIDIVAEVRTEKSCRRRNGAGAVFFGHSSSTFFSGARILYPTTVRAKARGNRDCTVKAVAQPIDLEKGFEEMVAKTTRQYYMLGGKGGVGKTSMAASLAVKFANSGHPTLVVSTDPAHSLSDSFAQDLTGGLLVPVEGLDFPLVALEINPEQTRKEFRDGGGDKGGGKGVQDFMDSMGLGGWVDQLSELKLGELLDTPPPGLDEAIAISKVVQFIQSPEYSHFTRIIFDTAPTGHTLRLLSLPDFLETSIGKLLKLKQKISSATNAIKSVFGQGDGKRDTAGEKLEALKERMIMVREIFRNKETTEFIIVTIPTVMAVSESSRLRESLKKEEVPVKRLIVNQILPPSTSDCKFCAIKRKDQQRAMDIVKDDPNLKDLDIIESPLFDLEIRGVPALTFMGNLVWKN